MKILPFINTLVYAINLGIILSLVFYNRERPEKVLAWFLVLVFLPPVGLFLYFYMGINWRDTVLNDRFSPTISDLIHKSLGSFEGPNADMARMVSNLNASPMFHHNEITLYKDGIEKFSALIKDLKNAKHHIHLEYYIIKSDELGRQIFDILKEKAESGVKVRVIMDTIS